MTERILCCLLYTSDAAVAGQFGIESSPVEYIEHLVEVFSEVKRVLRDDGTLWLNISDSYAGSHKGIWSKPVSERRKNKNTCQFEIESEIGKMPVTWEKIKPRDMIGIPWMLAFALRNDGWYLRSDIIWYKPNPMPENVKNRPSRCYEHIFLLSKTPRYYYDYQAIAEPIAESTVRRYGRKVSYKNKYAEAAYKQTIYKPRVNSLYMNMEKRNKRDIWTVSTNNFKMNVHYAMYPEKLIEPCILAGCPEGGTVLDPFFGSGTTGAAAKRLGRGYIGIDLNPVYCEAARKRIDEVKEDKDGSKNKSGD